MPDTISIPLIGEGPPTPIGLYDFLQAWPESQASLAVQNLAIYCMRANGWGIDPLGLGDVPPEVLLRDDVNGGFEEVVARWGYGTVTVLADPAGFREAYQSESNRASFLDNLDEADQAAFHADYAGTDPDELGGCMGWAQVGVAGPESLNPDFYDYIGTQWMHMRASSGYRELTSEWGECMVQDGVPSELAVEPAATFEHFESLADHIGPADDVAVLADEEVAVATADFRCREGVDFTNRIRELSAPFVGDVLAKYPDAVRQPFCDGRSGGCVMCTGDDVENLSLSTSIATDCVRPEAEVEFPEAGGPTPTNGDDG